MVYTTLNDNARRLAESMCAALKPGECIYKGKPSVEALAADVILRGTTQNFTRRKSSVF